MASKADSIIVRKDIDVEKFGPIRQLSHFYGRRPKFLKYYMMQGLHQITINVCVLLLRSGNGIILSLIDQLNPGPC